ncbi:hypothetical protein HRbin10_00865 [bacterium HR10]|nr:hypothetical protein HRbin10_00865 [bacterium HR10]
MSGMGVRRVEEGLRFGSGAGSQAGRSAWCALLPLGIGVVLGPTGLGWLHPFVLPGGWEVGDRGWPRAAIAGMAELGLVQIIFLAGARDGRESWRWRALLRLAASHFAFGAGSLLVVALALGVEGAAACAIAGVLSTASFVLSPFGSVWARREEPRAADPASVLAVLGALLVLIAVGWEWTSSSGAHLAAIGVGLYIVKTGLVVGIADRILAWYVMRVERWARVERRVGAGSGIELRHQAFVGFLILFAIFYGWAAWRVGPLAAMGVAYLGGRRFGRSLFRNKSAMGAFPWLARLPVGALFLALGATLDARALGQRIGEFLALLGGGAIGKALGLLATARWMRSSDLTDVPCDSEGRARARSRRALDMPWGGEIGWVLAGFAFSRGVISPEVLSVVLGIIGSTTLGALLFRGGEARVGDGATPNSLRGGRRWGE